MIPKTMNINTRVDVIDYFEIAGLADRLKISKSELMRLSYRGELHKRMTYMDLTNDELKELYNRLDLVIDKLGKTQNELRRIGANLNQLTKLSRQEGNVMHSNQLDDLNIKLDSLLRVWEGVAKRITEVKHGNI